MLPFQASLNPPVLAAFPTQQQQVFAMQAKANSAEQRARAMEGRAVTAEKQSGRMETMYSDCQKENKRLSAEIQKRNFAKAKLSL